MVASNELDATYFVETAKMLFQIAADVAEKLDVRIEIVNIGGGIGIPYRPGETAVDFNFIGDGLHTACTVSRSPR